MAPSDISHVTTDKMAGSEWHVTQDKMAARGKAVLTDYEIDSRGGEMTTTANWLQKSPDRNRNDQNSFL